MMLTAGIEADDGKYRSLGGFGSAANAGGVGAAGALAALSLLPAAAQPLLCRSRQPSNGRSTKFART
jgi:hypothetical protein